MKHKEKRDSSPKKKMKEDNISKLRDNFNPFNICITQILQREWRIEKIFDGANFPKYNENYKHINLSSVNSKWETWIKVHQGKKYSNSLKLVIKRWILKVTREEKNKWLTRGG